MAKYAFGVVLAAFVEPIHIELTYEAVYFLMPEVLRQDYLLKFVDVLDDELLARVPPENYFRVLLVLN